MTFYDSYFFASPIISLNTSIICPDLVAVPMFTYSPGVTHSESPLQQNGNQTSMDMK